MTRLELMQLSQGLSDLYTGLETDLLANIAAFLTAEQADMPSAQWKIQMLAQLGALDRKNLRTITQYVKNVPRMLQDTLQAGVLSALEDLEPGFRQMVLDGILQGTDTPVEDTIARALKAYARQARKSMNMVNTVMRYKARDAAHKAINDTAELADKQEFLNVLNKATGKTVSGIESRQAAMRQCIKEMTDKGIPAFVDKRGREWSPEAYVNMAIRTTVANTAQQAQFDRMDDYGLDLVEVSSHSGARPKCAKDQGKIFNRSGGGYTTDLHGRKIRYYAWSESSYGEPDGILGINCGHQIYPFTPGVSYQTYFPEPEEENAEAYKKSQQQRELERRVRKSKRECMMLETAGDPEGARQAQQLLKQRQDALRQFCGDNGLRYKPDRTAVADYKKSVAGYVPPDQTERIRKLNGEQYLKGDYSVKFNKISGAKEVTKDLAKEFSDQHDKAARIFGFEKLTKMSSVSVMPYHNDGFYGSFTPTSGVVTIFGAGGKDGKAFMSKVAKEMKKKGVWSTDSPLHAYRHELGHAIQEQLSASDSSYAEKLKMITDFRKSILDDLTKLPERDIIKEKARLLSAYGISNKGEIDDFISEGIAEYLNGKPRPTAKKIVDILLGRS